MAFSEVYILRLKELLKDVSYFLIKGTENIDIKGIYYDSTDVKNNSLFLAIKGYKQDGHKYILDAIKKGALVIVYEEDIDFYYEGITYIRVDNCRLNLSIISRNFYKDPSSKLKVIGVTGTNGKTSTCYMLYHILNYSGKKSGLIGTLGSLFEGSKGETNNTTPEAPILNQIMVHMVNEGIEYVLMEVSSHSLDLYRVHNIAFKDAIFTNLTQDHLDFHKDMQEYFNAKIKLFKMTNDFNIVNIDDRYGKELAHSLSIQGIDVSTFSIDNISECMAKDIKYNNGTMEFMYTSSKGQGLIKCPMSGKFILYNLLGAMSVAEKEGVEFSVLQESIKNLPPVPGRFERIDINRDYDIYIDYAHTPDGLKNVLNTIRDMHKYRIITLFGCGGDRDKTKRIPMGRIAGDLSDFCVVTSDNPRTEDPEIIIQEILVGIKESGVDYVVISDRYEAIKYTLKFAKDNDLILLAGKGHETYQVLKNGIIPFDEKKIVKEILEHDPY